MYVSEGERNKLKSQGFIDRDAVCYVCGIDLDIFWHGSHGDIALCLQHGQYIGTHLLKDVRTGEIDKGLSVKVRTEISETNVFKKQLGLFDISDVI